MDPEERENLIKLLLQRNEEAAKQAYEDLDENFDMDSLHSSVPTVGLSTPAQLTGKIPQGGLNVQRNNNNDNKSNNNNNNNDDGSTEKKKKKKKKKSKTSKLPEAGTEVTEDYKEYDDKDVIEDPYDPSRPLARRVEYAIWKYKKNHRFTDANRAIFDDYLKFGGINISPNAFLGRATGADSVNADKDGGEVEMDFEAAKAATAVIEDDELEDGVYISFSEVAQVYLGNRFLSPWSIFVSLADHQNAPKLVDAFLRYLEIRNVCPEYRQDISKAREFVNLAKSEMPPCKRVKKLLPGQWNYACQILYNNKFSSNNNNNDDNDDDKDDNDWMKNLTDPMAKQLIAELVLNNSNNKEGESKEIKEAKQLLSKVFKSQDIEQLFIKVDDFQLWAKIKEIQPSGLLLKDDYLYKVTLVKYDRIHNKTLDDGQIYDLYFEESIIQEFLIGGVVDFRLNQLSNGQWYLKTSFGVYPTFYLRDQFDENEYD